MSEEIKHLGRSRPQTAQRGYFGPLPQRVFAVLHRCHSNPPYLSSNFVREHDADIAFAASIGWISSISINGRDFTRQWRITLSGLTALETKDNT